MTATSEPITVNSYMFAHGMRPAAIPRSTTPTTSSRMPSVVTDIAMPSERPGR